MEREGRSCSRQNREQQAAACAAHRLTAPPLAAQKKTPKKPEKNRHDVRSEPRYIASFESQVTSGTGFVGSLSLVAAFDPPAAGRLSHLLWWNLTCADCGGAASERCLGATACALPAAACTCAGGGGSALPSSTPAPLDAASGSEAAAPPPARRRRGLKQDGVSQADGGGATAATTAATAPPPAPPEATCDFGSLSM